MKKVFAVHTALAMIEPISQLFKEHLPNVKLHHIVDDSLIQEVIANNSVTPAVARRLVNCFFMAVDGGADAIFNTCSSVGEIAQIARKLLPIPLLKIDDPMAVEAVEAASRIGVLATLPTTLAPTVQLLKNIAGERNKAIEVVEGLAEGAFHAMMSGDRDTHDNLIITASERVADKVDLIVLAQGSMGRMAGELEKVTGKKVLSSPLSGVLGVRKFLNL
ncbi:MAG: aspartate/glutamate racemase family protein [Bacteroidales bacterium]